MTTRKSYLGGAVPTSISSGTFSVGATTLTLTVATGWPTTTNGPFVATIDRLLPTQEKILIHTRTGVTCSAIIRGYDGTSEVGHGSNASIEHCLDAVTLDEANRLSSLLTTKGDDLGHDGTQVQRLAVGAAGTYLTATPAAATGKSWTAPPAPPSSLVTAKGQVLAASAAGVLAPTNTPTTGQILVGDTTQTAGVRFGQLPTVRVRRVAAQTLGNFTSEFVLFDTEDQDSDSLFAPTTGDLFNTVAQGMWSVTVRITFATYATFGVSSSDRMFIYEVGGLGQQFTYYPKNVNQALVEHYMHANIYKTTGAIRCGVIQASGAATNITAVANFVRVST